MDTDRLSHEEDPGTDPDVSSFPLPPAPDGNTDVPAGTAAAGAVPDDAVRPDAPKVSEGTGAPAKSGEGQDEPVPAPGKKKKKGGLILLIIALLMLIALACGWYFLLGPGAYKEYTITFDTAGGEPIEPMKVPPTGSHMLPVPVRDGYVFETWKQGTLPVTSPYTAASDVTLTAVWVADEYEITFIATGTDLPEDTWKWTYEYGEPVEFPVEPDRKGYVISGWRLPDGTEFKEYTPMPAQDLVLIIEWERKYFNITFDSNGGTPVSPIRIAEGDPFPDITSTKENMVFLRWKDPHGNVVYPGDNFFWEDTTLTAVWGTKTFKVSFDSRGGSGVPDIYVNAGDELRLPSDPVRDGYEFQCWEDRNGHPIYDRALLTPEDITLYAVWRRPELEITVLGSDEIQSQSVSGDTITLYIYSVWNTTRLVANQPVKWTYNTGEGAIFDIVEHEDDFFFTACYVASGNDYRNATIKAESDDGQEITIVVNPVQGHP